MRNSRDFKIVYEKYVKEFHITADQDLGELQINELEIRYEEAAKNQLESAEGT